LDARLCFTGTGIKYHRGIDRVYAIRVIAMKHGKPVSPPGTLGKQTARNAEEDAGKGKRKKRNG